MFKLTQSPIRASSPNLLNIRYVHPHLLAFNIQYVLLNTLGNFNNKQQLKQLQLLPLKLLTQNEVTKHKGPKADQRKHKRNKAIKLTGMPC
jgi:hypothetical protein